MAYSIQYSPNGAKPMISNYVKVSHAWFDYIKNHTDINLHGFTLTNYSNYVSIGYYHSTKSYEKEFKMTAYELSREDRENEIAIIRKASVSYETNRDEYDDTFRELEAHLLVYRIPFTYVTYPEGSFEELRRTTAYYKDSEYHVNRDK